jgi:hypothetical protein
VQARLASLSETELDAALFRAGVDYIRQNPMEWLALLLVKLKGFWWFRTHIGFQYDESWTQYYAVVYVVLIALLIPGLIVSLRRWRSFMLLYFLLAYYTITYVAFQVQTRYRWEIEPYLLIFAALTADQVLNAVQLRRHGVRTH